MTTLFHMTDRRFGISQIEAALLAVPDQMLLAADRFGTTEIGLRQARAMIIDFVRYNLLRQEDRALASARNWMQI